MKNGRFRAGDRVFVRSPEEILSTLDADGALDGVLFMPEMLDWCGKPYRVQRRVQKTCVDGYSMRRFPADDVVILDGPRCDGSGHDGCKHGCRIFWKEAWLRPADPLAMADAVSTTSLATLRARLRTKADAQRYYCQSTELYKATTGFPGSRRLLTIRVALREILSGDLSLAGFVRLLGRWLALRWQRRRGVDQRLEGPCKRTPSQTLALRSGERVRVKTLDEIVKTLNHDHRNRGLVICYEMTRCCGKEAEVRYRVDRIIDERTGLMREIPDTVTLCNVGGDAQLAEECLCKGQLGDCPRGELMYWREIWLERVAAHDRPFNAT
jgi:hypothetical protein